MTCARCQLFCRRFSSIFPLLSPAQEKKEETCNSFYAIRCTTCMRGRDVKPLDVAFWPALPLCFYGGIKTIHSSIHQAPSKLFCARTDQRFTTRKPICLRATLTKEMHRTICRYALSLKIFMYMVSYLNKNLLISEQAIHSSLIYACPHSRRAGMLHDWRPSRRRSVISCLK